MPRKPDSSTATATLPTQRIVPIADIAFDPRNPRKDFSKVAEIAASIAKTGINDVAIKVRPVECVGPELAKKLKGARYMLVYGEQRVHAAAKAKITALKAEVVELDDVAAFDELMRENTARSNLTPIEEAAGYEAQLAAHPDWTDEMLAAEHGVPVSRIARRRQLAKLIPEWRDRANGSIKSAVAGWPVKHLEFVAAFEPATQLALLGAEKFERDQIDRDEGSHRDLRWRLRKLTHEVRLAPWPVDDAALLPEAGACIACPKRTSCKAHLFTAQEVEEFGETGEKGKGQKGVTAGDKCLDHACWDAKAAALVKRSLDAAKAEHGKDVKKLSEGHGYHKLPKGTLSTYEVKEVKAGTKGATPTVIVSGSRIGQTIYTAPAPTRGFTSRVAEQRGEKPVKARRKELAKRRLEWAKRELEKGVKAIKTPPALKIVVSLAAVFEVERPWNREKREESDGATLAALIKGSDADRLKALWAIVQPAVARIAGSFSTAAATCEAIAAALGSASDWTNLQARAEEKFPEPKGWARLEEKEKAERKAAKDSGKGKAATKAKGKRGRKASDGPTAEDRRIAAIEAGEIEEDEAFEDGGFEDGENY